ncbi:vWA domain-containing protein [Marisediminicola senii]|uniref:vWA domain-containing protein n=1 Tax=Marisediminicola senii TaxID=2711233 RepID=UPI0013EB749F|nr:VWA domain-containing protein [Marisediminicola senii]
MELILWWMPPALAIAAAIVVLLQLRARRTRRADTAEPRPIAHSDRLTALPEYRSAMRRYRGLLAAVTAAAGILAIAAALLASRPAAVSVQQPELATRDIVLCLDVSGSMVEYDAELVRVFGELTEQFTGERIALVVFNASAVTYFPLTNDYEYVQEQFDTVTDQFTNGEDAYFDGTFFGEGSSLVGDGLAACSLRFDAPDDDRSRSIILATDNLVVGDPIFTLTEAGQVAADRGIHVYGVNPGDTASRDYVEELAREFRTVVDATGGAYYSLDEPDAIESIVASITSEQATIVTGSPRLQLADQPAVPLAIAFFGLAGLMVLAWRVQR